jgi:C-terminal processing protease CtpA/Prc
LQVGDRIIALAQGSGAFVDMYQAPLEEVVQTIRGAPNTVLQLKVLPAGAAPNTPPRTVVILRDQIKFKK